MEINRINHFVSIVQLAMIIYVEEEYGFSDSNIHGHTSTQLSLTMVRGAMVYQLCRCGCESTISGNTKLFHDLNSAAADAVLSEFLMGIPA
jgi:PII-like signaling protein